MINPSKNAHELALEPLGLGELWLTGELTASGGEVALRGGTLSLPAYSIAVLRA